ncbi:MAG: beta-lactamase family protein [Gemmatimonadaceae bacterium]|nr:beta-lactamase family protein [Gemmatimonadaceae bacterium]
MYAEQYTPSIDPVDRDTRFPLASMSKWFTAYAVMQLLEAGRVDLDAPVTAHLRQWQLPAGPFDARQVTIRRLLSHTAGLTDGLGFGDYLPSEGRLRPGAGAVRCRCQRAAATGGPRSHAAPARPQVRARHPGAWRGALRPDGQRRVRVRPRWRQRTSHQHVDADQPGQWRCRDRAGHRAPHAGFRDRQ